MANIIICDRCGERIESNTSLKWWVVDARKGLKNDVDDIKEHKLDLCETCQMSLENWTKEIKKEIKIGEEVK